MPSQIRKFRVQKLVSANPVNIGTIRFGPGKYGILREIRARNWASSAKAAGGTDTAIRIKITDGNSNVVYLDAADRDYATAEVVLLPTQDDTATGLGTTPVDATGAAASAGAGGPIILQSPVTVAAVNGTTATDYLTVDLLIEA